MTSGITLDGTINPDFSQVESDAFQVFTHTLHDGRNNVTAAGDISLRRGAAHQMSATFPHHAHDHS